MRSAIISLIFIAGLGLAFFVGERAESQDSKKKAEAAGYCEHCAAKHGKGHHGKGHHGKPHAYEYSCIVGSTEKKPGQRAPENTSVFNKLGDQGWRLVSHDGVEFCFMRHKR